MTRIDTPPTRRVLFGRETWDLVLDMRALYVLEVEGGVPYFRALAEAWNNDADLQPKFLLVWALTAHQRARDKAHFLHSEEERARGYMVPPSFVAKLPYGAAWDELCVGLLEMVRDSGLIKFTKPNPSSEDAPPDPL